MLKTEIKYYFFLKLGSIIQEIDSNGNKGVIPEHNAIYHSI